MDNEGKLHLSKAATTENLAELYATVRDGLLMEVLSWKIMTEEPDAVA